MILPSLSAIRIRAVRPSPAHRWLLAVAGTVATMAGRPASAAPPSQPIVVEARVGERPADADALLGPVLAELARCGFAGPAAGAARIEQEVSRSSTPLTDAEVAEALQAVEGGYKLFLAGKFDAAARDIERGLRV